MRREGHVVTVLVRTLGLSGLGSRSRSPWNLEIQSTYMASVGLPGFRESDPGHG